MKSIDANVKSIKADGESVSELYNVHLNFYEIDENYFEDFGLTFAMIWRQDFSEFDNSRRKGGTTAFSSTSAAGRLAERTAKLRRTVWSGGFALTKSALPPLQQIRDKDLLPCMYFCTSNR